MTWYAMTEFSQVRASPSLPSFPPSFLPPSCPHTAATARHGRLRVKCPIRPVYRPLDHRKMRDLQTKMRTSLTYGVGNGLVSVGVGNVGVSCLEPGCVGVGNVCVSCLGTGVLGMGTGWLGLGTVWRDWKNVVEVRVDLSELRDELVEW